MIVLQKTIVARVVAAVLLLAFYPSTSKVLCVSPNGHEAIEDSASICCAPPADAPGTAFSEPGICQGCTDYPLVQAGEIKRSQPNSLRDFHHGSLILLAAVTAEQSLAITIVSPLAPLCLREPVASPSATSLRC